MLEYKDIDNLKEKACKEIMKLRQKMDNQNEIPKADWESLVLALKAYEKLMNIEHMESTGYSGYMRNYSRDDYSGKRDSMGRYTADDYSGRRWDDMRDREYMDRMMYRR